MHLPIALDLPLVRRAGTAVAIALLVGACGPSASAASPTLSTAAIAAPTTSTTAVIAAPPAPAAVRQVPASGGVAGRTFAPPLTAPATGGGRFPGGLLIADRGNGRLLVVSSTGAPLWRFPTTGSLPRGQGFAADDAFLAPDGKTIVANDEGHHVIDRIDIATRKIVWQYGHYGRPGRGAGYLNTPDDAYPLANGDVVVADIRNCRVIEISPVKRIVRQWGTTGRCVASAPNAYASPNGDTPLPDGGLLITEIHGSRVVRLSATGKVIFDIHVPVAYPSDAQLDSQGNVIVVDYSNPGAVVAVTPTGQVLWRYAPTSGLGRMDHPSLGTP